MGGCESCTRALRWGYMGIPRSFQYAFSTVQVEKTGLYIPLSALFNSYSFLKTAPQVLFKRKTIVPCHLGPACSWLQIPHTGPSANRTDKQWRIAQVLLRRQGEVPRHQADFSGLVSNYTAWWSLLCSIYILSVVSLRRNAGFT